MASHRTPKVARCTRLVPADRRPGHRQGDGRRLAAGQSLPSIRELAAASRVSVITVQARLRRARARRRHRHPPGQGLGGGRAPRPAHGLMHEELPAPALAGACWPCAARLGLARAATCTSTARPGRDRRGRAPPTHHPPKDPRHDRSPSRCNRHRASATRTSRCRTSTLDPARRPGDGPGRRQRRRQDHAAAPADRTGLGRRRRASTCSAIACRSAQVAAKRDIGFASDDMRLYRGQTLRWHMDLIRAHLPRLGRGATRTSCSSASTCAPEQARRRLLARPARQGAAAAVPGAPPAPAAAGRTDHRPGPGGAHRSARSAGRRAARRTPQRAVLLAQHRTTSSSSPTTSPSCTRAGWWRIADKEAFVDTLAPHRSATARCPPRSRPGRKSPGARQRQPGGNQGAQLATTTLPARLAGAGSGRCSASTRWRWKTSSSPPYALEAVA